MVKMPSFSVAIPATKIIASTIATRPMDGCPCSIGKWRISQSAPGRPTNHTNNSRTLEPRADEASLKWSLKWMVWLQDLMLTYGFFV